MNLLTVPLFAPSTYLGGSKYFSGVSNLYANEYGILDDVTIRHLPGNLSTFN